MGNSMNEPSVDTKYTKNTKINSEKKSKKKKNKVAPSNEGRKQKQMDYDEEFE